MDNEKREILFGILLNRYEDLHKMRERSLTFAMWIMGLGIALVWILFQQKSLDIIQKVTLTAFVILIYFFSKKFIRAIETGTNKTRAIVIKIEEELNFYKDGEYITANTLFPSEYRFKPNPKTHHFSTLLNLISLIVFFLVIMIWRDLLAGPLSQYLCQHICSPGG